LQCSDKAFDPLTYTTTLAGDIMRFASLTRTSHPPDEILVPENQMSTTFQTEMKLFLKNDIYMHPSQ